MSDNSKILEELKEHNPFFSAISPSPFENKNSDLENLNRGTSEEIYHLLKYKRFQPETPIAGLVIGEAGAGKTHMLARILRRLRKYSNPIVFVSVKTAKALTNPETVTQGLWAEIFTSLAQIHSNGHSQFDMLLSEMMDSYRERRTEDGFTDLTKLDPRIYLAKDMLELNKDFLNSLMIYLGSSDEMTRMKVFEWLRDGLEDEDSTSIGLPIRNLHTMSSAACEETARKFLISLGYVLAYAKMSMVICFDQLEAVKSKDLIHALGVAINILVNDMPGIVPLCFVKPAYWDDVLKPILDPSIRERLEEHKMTLKGCSVEQAKQLIHDRIASVFTEGVEEKYSWLIRYAENLLKPGLSPRRVIELAYNVIMTTKPGTDEEEIFDTFKNIYESELRAIQDKPNTWIPNSVHLASALKVWLEAHEYFETSAGDGKYIPFIGTDGKRNYAFPIITAKNHATAVAGIKRGITFLQKHPGGVCCYITEEKTHKAWKRFIEQQGIFESLNGKIIILNNNKRAEWYALTSLINQIESGDVNLYLSTGERPANLADLREFAASLDLIPGLFAPAKTAPKSQPSRPKESPTLTASPEIIKTKLSSVVKASPMKILAVDKALALLAEKGLILSRNDLISFLKSSKTYFRTYTTSSGEIVIGLTGK